jgi:hypothetical protein
MALDRFKKKIDDNSINVHSWHQSTGGFTAGDARINLQSLKGVRREQFDLVDDNTLETKKKAKEDFKKLSKNGRDALKIDEEVAKEITLNNTQLIKTGEAVSNAEVSNQKLLGQFNNTLQKNRVQMARIKANSYQLIESSNSQVNAIWSAQKQETRDAIF